MMPLTEWWEAVQFTYIGALVMLRNPLTNGPAIPLTVRTLSRRVLSCTGEMNRSFKAASRGGEVTADATIPFFNRFYGESARR
jgi:hypothetical protein